MSFVYFTDRDLGLRFPEILRNAGLMVECHHDHFAHDAADEEWLAEAGRRGWIAVTHPALATSFVATLQRIERFLERHSPPLIAKVYRAGPAELARNPFAAGRIERWYPE